MKVFGCLAISLIFGFFFAAIWTGSTSATEKLTNTGFVLMLYTGCVGAVLFGERLP